MFYINMYVSPYSWSLSHIQKILYLKILYILLKLYFKIRSYSPPSSNNLRLSRKAMLEDNPHEYKISNLKVSVLAVSVVFFHNNQKCVYFIFSSSCESYNFHSWTSGLWHFKSFPYCTVGLQTDFLAQNSWFFFI